MAQRCYVKQDQTTSQVREEQQVIMQDKCIWSPAEEMFLNIMMTYWACVSH